MTAWTTRPLHHDPRTGAWTMDPVHGVSHIPPGPRRATPEWRWWPVPPGHPDYDAPSPTRLG